MSIWRFGTCTSTEYLYETTPVVHFVFSVPYKFDTSPAPLYAYEHVYEIIVWFTPYWMEVVLFDVAA
jgi:hypothetical protein